MLPCYLGQVQLQVVTLSKHRKMVLNVKSTRFSLTLMARIAFLGFLISVIFSFVKNVQDSNDEVIGLRFSYLTYLLTVGLWLTDLYIIIFFLMSNASNRISHRTSQIQKTSFSVMILLFSTIQLCNCLLIKYLSSQEVVVLGKVIFLEFFKLFW